MKYILPKNTIHIKIGILFLLAVFACKKDTENMSKITYDNKITIKDSIEIPIGNDELYSSRISQIIEQRDSTFLYRSNDHENAMDVYNWTSKEKVKRINFKKEGPNGVNRFKYDVVHEIKNDSFLIANFIGEIYILYKNEVTFHRRLIDIENDSKKVKFEGNYFFQATNMRPSMSIDSDIYCALGAFDSGEIWSDYFYKSKLLMKFNINTKKYEKLNRAFPDSFLGKCWGSSSYSLSSHTLNSDNNIVCIFASEPKVYVFDTKKNRYSLEKEFNSIYATKIPSVSCSSSTSSVKENAFLRRNSFYEWIRYDRYKSIYYVLVRLPFETLDLEQPKEKESYTIAPFSLLVLDNNFKSIAEKKIRGKKFDYRDFFITKEGLWISNNTPYNDFFDENKIKFTLFSFNEK